MEFKAKVQGKVRAAHLGFVITHEAWYAAKDERPQVELFLADDNGRAAWDAVIEWVNDKPTLKIPVDVSLVGLAASNALTVLLSLLDNGIAIVPEEVARRLKLAGWTDDTKRLRKDGVR